jgi:hypothetical protein
MMDWDKIAAAVRRGEAVTLFGKKYIPVDKEATVVETHVLKTPAGPLRSLVLMSDGSVRWR